MKLTPTGEPRQPKLLSREVLEVERELSPWQQVEQWTKIAQPEIVAQTLAAKGSWRYMLMAPPAMDLYPDLLPEFRLPATDWERYSKMSDFRDASKQEYARGAVRLFPSRQLDVLMKFHHETGTAEFFGLGKSKLDFLEDTLFLDVMRPERKPEWQRMRERLRPAIWSELQQSIDKSSALPPLSLPHAARFLLAFPDARADVQELFTKDWSLIVKAHAEIKQMNAQELSRFVRFLRSLKIVLAGRVELDKYGGVQFQAPAGLLSENRSPLPERPSV